MQKVIDIATLQFFKKLGRWQIDKKQQQLENEAKGIQNEVQMNKPQDR